MVKFLVFLIGLVLAIGAFAMWGEPLLLLLFHLSMWFGFRIIFGISPNVKGAKDRVQAEIKKRALHRELALDAEVEFFNDNFGEAIPIETITREFSKTAWDIQQSEEAYRKAVSVAQYWGFEIPRITERKGVK